MERLCQVIGLHAPLEQRNCRFGVSGTFAGERHVGEAPDELPPQLLPQHDRPRGFALVLQELAPVQIEHAFQPGRVAQRAFEGRHVDPDGAVVERHDPVLDSHPLGRSQQPAQAVRCRAEGFPRRIALEVRPQPIAQE